MLLATSDAEMLLFFRLGLKFTSAAGLEQLSGERVRMLFARRAAHPQQRRYMLVLPGWQIVDCANTPAPKTLGTLAHIARIQYDFDFDPGAVFGLWIPSASDFRDFLSGLAFADRRIIAGRLASSLEHSRFSPAAALNVIHDRTEPSYGVARGQLQRAIDSSGLVPRAGEVGAALAIFQRVFQSSVLTQFLAAAAGKNPWEQLRLMMVEQTARRWFEQLEIVIAARKIMAGEYPDHREDERLFDEQLRLTREFAKLYRLKPPR